jgi:hypothetical protein
MLGQVAYHLLNASHAARAPWPVVVLVSSLPVIVLGFGAALSHLLRGESGEPANALEVNPETVLAERPETIPTVPESAPEPVTASRLRVHQRVHGRQPRRALREQRGERRGRLR